MAMTRETYVKNSHELAYKAAITDLLNVYSHKLDKIVKNNKSKLGGLTSDDILLDVSKNLSKIKGTNDYYKAFALVNIMSELNKISSSDLKNNLSFSKKIDSLYGSFLGELTADPSVSITNTKIIRPGFFGYRNSYLTDSFKQFGEFTKKVAKVNESATKEASSDMKGSEVIQDLFAAVVFKFQSEKVSAGYVSEEESNRTRMLSELTQSVYAIEGSSEVAIQKLVENIVNFSAHIEMLRLLQNVERVIDVGKSKWDKIINKDILPLIAEAAGKLNLHIDLLDPSRFSAAVEKQTAVARVKHGLEEIKTIKGMMSANIRNDTFEMPNVTLAWKIQQIEQTIEKITKKENLNLEAITNDVNQVVNREHRSASMPMMSSPASTLQKAKASGADVHHRNSLPGIPEEKLKASVPLAMKEAPNADSFNTMKAEMAVGNRRSMKI